MLLGITCTHCCKCMHKCKMHNQQGPTVEQVELRSVLCGTLDGRGVWGRIDTCICRAESFCCWPETITLLISCTPIQSKTFKLYIYIHYSVKNLIVFYRKTNKDNSLSGGKSFYHYKFQMLVLYTNSVRNTVPHNHHPFCGKQ